MRLIPLAAAALAGLALVSAAGATERPLVDAAWLQAHLDDDGLVVLDVRGADRYAAAHVPGAVSAPYGSAGWQRAIDGVPGEFPGVEAAAGLIGRLGIDNDEHVVIVADGASSTAFGAATRVYWTFAVLGHDAVSILDGGARAWDAAGGPVTAEPATPEPTTFTADFRPELLATTADVEQAIAAGVALVDGRPAAQYRGETRSRIVRAAGTLPGAVNIEHSRFYDAENAAFADAATIADLAAAAGLEVGEPVIAFCNTGHWSSIVWFGLSEVLGNGNVRLYDGSMAAWTLDPSRPLQVAD